MSEKTAGPPSQVAERLSRFINKRHYARTLRKVKSGAFMPVEDCKTSVFQRSVFQTSGLSDNEIWKIGDKYVTNSFTGRADVSVADVESVNLTIVRDNCPPRHANIVGWPKEQEDQLEIARILAERASLVLRAERES